MHRRTKSIHCMLIERKFSLRRFFLVSVCVAGLAGAQSSYSQSSEEAKLTAELSAELKKQFSIPEQLDLIVSKSYGVSLSPEKTIVARNSLRALMFNEALPGYMARILSPVNRPGITSGERSAAILQSVSQMQTKGLGRLSADKQMAFLKHVIATTRFISAADCKAIYQGKMDAATSAALERRYIATLPLGRFEAITSLYRAAAEAELSGYPDARTINAQQAKLAEKVFEDASVKRLVAQVPQDVIQRYIQDSEGAAASDVCAVMATSAEGMLDMTEPYRSWQLTRFAESMQ